MSVGLAVPIKDKKKNLFLTQRDADTLEVSITKAGWGDLLYLEVVVNRRDLLETLNQLNIQYWNSLASQEE